DAELLLQLIVGILSEPGGLVAPDALAMHVGFATLGDVRAGSERRFVDVSVLCRVPSLEVKIGARRLGRGKDLQNASIVGYSCIEPIGRMLGVENGRGESNSPHQRSGSLPGASLLAPRTARLVFHETEDLLRDRDGLSAGMIRE